MRLFCPGTRLNLPLGSIGGWNLRQYRGESCHPYNYLFTLGFWWQGMFLLDHSVESVLGSVER